MKNGVTTFTALPPYFEGRVVFTPLIYMLLFQFTCNVMIKINIGSLFVFFDPEHKNMVSLHLQSCIQHRHTSSCSYEKLTTLCCSIWAGVNTAQHGNQKPGQISFLEIGSHVQQNKRISRTMLSISNIQKSVKVVSITAEQEQEWTRFILGFGGLNTCLIGLLKPREKLEQSG